jgi:hypothetical protein
MVFTDEHPVKQPAIVVARVAHCEGILHPANKFHPSNIKNSYVWALNSRIKRRRR